LIIVPAMAGRLFHTARTLPLKQLAEQECRLLASEKAAFG